MLPGARIYIFRQRFFLFKFTNCMKRINLNPITGFQAKLYHILAFFFTNDKAFFSLFFL